jgi:hypothetical protein
MGKMEEVKKMREINGEMGKREEVKEVREISQCIN